MLSSSASTRCCICAIKHIYGTIRGRSAGAGPVVWALAVVWHSGVEGAVPRWRKWAGGTGLERWWGSRGLCQILFVSGPLFFLDLFIFFPKKPDPEVPKSALAVLRN